MAGSLNRVQLIGHLGKDPESRSFQNGGRVVSFSVATSESWKDKNSGERKEKTEWHNVSVFSEHTAGFVEKYLRKGAKVYVEGKMQTRKWQDQQGNDRYSTEVVIQGFDGQVISLDKREGGSDRGGGEYDQDRGSGEDQGGFQSRRPGDSGGERGGGFAGGGRQAAFDSDLDDEVPF